MSQLLEGLSKVRDQIKTYRAKHDKLKEEVMALRQSKKALLIPSHSQDSLNSAGTRTPVEPLSEQKPLSAGTSFQEADSTVDESYDSDAATEASSAVAAPSVSVGNTSVAITESTKKRKRQEGSGTARQKIRKTNNAT
jgi:hypothetical protein